MSFKIYAVQNARKRLPTNYYTFFFFLLYVMCTDLRTRVRKGKCVKHTKLIYGGTLNLWNVKNRWSLATQAMPALLHQKKWSNHLLQETLYMNKYRTAFWFQSCSYDYVSEPTKLITIVKEEEERETYRTTMRALTTLTICKLKK